MKFMPKVCVSRRCCCWARPPCFFACGVLLLTLLVIVMFWDTNRLLAIGGFAVLYLAIGAGLAMAARARAAAGSRLFEASLGELKKDHDRLSV